MGVYLVSASESCWPAVFTAMAENLSRVGIDAEIRVPAYTRHPLPVATCSLALLGADVLRIDSPRMPEMVSQHLDNGMGILPALLDLREPEQLAILERLLDFADVVVTGYRQHALDAFFDPATLVARRPGLVIASLDAWSSTGPWRDHRGFDSIVQAASGISMLESANHAPGALLAQALDHATGNLLAAGVLHSVQRQKSQGGT
jgi:crotonobetainyl-CoA:carnitine CoA-transferase CaiB-like acyl-CoA transferase